MGKVKGKKSKKPKTKLKLKVKGKKAKKPKAKLKLKVKAKKGKKRQLQTVTPQTVGVNSKTGVDVAKAYPDTGLAEMKSEPASGQSSANLFKMMLALIIGLWTIMF